MTLFWSPTGPVMDYRSGVLRVEDLNPQVLTRWRMSRFEMVKLGLRCLWAAVRP